MKKEIFIEIMDKAIEAIKNDIQEFSCTAIQYSKSSSEISRKIRENYADFYNCEKDTFAVMLPGYTNKQLKNVRLVALELYKEMTLDD